MTTYMVTSVWRGSHHICNMRGFTDQAAATAYANQLDEYDVRVYQLSDDPNQEPKIIHSSGRKVNGRKTQ